jgi:prepilin-type N-terminal cleavage/methylation domain-containing protein
MQLPQKLTNRGDTIVEVLVAIAIVSSVLAGAYASANRSSKVTRTAQERGEALKLAESQIEQVKIALDSGVTLPTNFCFNAAGGVQTPAPCIIGTIVYEQSITRAGNDYTVTINWDALTGSNSENSLQLDYRVQ